MTSTSQMGFEIGLPTTEIRGVSKCPRTLKHPVCHRRSPRLPSAVTPFFPCSLARSSSSHLTRPLGDFVTVAPDALFIPALYPLHIPESLGVGVERDWRLNAEGFLVRLGIPGASSEDVSFGETDNRFAITIFGPRSTKSS